MNTMWEAAKVYVEKRVPWRDRGRSLSGVDCVGLIICCARDVGYDIDPKNELHREMPIGQLTSYFASHFNRVEKDKMQFGDSVFFGERTATMIGILSPGSPFNIILAPFRGYVSEIPYNQYMRQLRGVLRLKGV